MRTVLALLLATVTSLAIVRVFNEAPATPYGTKAAIAAWIDGVLSGASFGVSDDVIGWVCGSETVDEIKRAREANDGSWRLGRAMGVIALVGAAIVIAIRVRRRFRD